MAVEQPLLQQNNLSAFGRRLRETDPNADETHWFASASERFGEERPEILQSGNKTGASGGGPSKVVELQFHKNLRYRSRRFLLGKISHQFLEEFLQFLFALLDRGKIDRECFLCAERFAWTIRFDRPVIDTAAKIVEFNAEFTIRSEEHTSELQSPYDLVCRLLLE